MRGALDDRVETEAHDRDAIQFGLIRVLPPHSAGAGGYGRADKKLTSFHHTHPRTLVLGPGIAESIHPIHKPLNDCEWLVTDCLADSTATAGCVNPRPFGSIALH